VNFKAYAKINLGLRILAKRPDGFHDIETVFHRIDVWDDLSLEPSGTIEVLSDNPQAPGDRSNICFKAAEILRAHVAASEGVRISVNKRIPVGAGLGGVLRALPEFWNKHLDTDTLRSFAARLGSDVPYFLGAGSALARGRGEVLEYFPLSLPFTILLCYPNIHVNTAWAYSQVTPNPRNDQPDLRSILLGGLRDPRCMSGELTNDFEVPLFKAYPAIQSVKESMLAGGALFASMSGSGSTVYGLFDDARAAAKLAGRFGGETYRTFITPPYFNAEGYS
jgi:4-diphosphocytidyl-2-C-methyl-D-erythritol kinase